MLGSHDVKSIIAWSSLAPISSNIRIVKGSTVKPKVFNKRISFALPEFVVDNSGLVSRSTVVSEVGSGFESGFGSLSGVFSSGSDKNEVFDRFRGVF